MRKSGTYQLVSEHSILSARRENRVAAMEEILENQAQHSKTEWKAEIDKIKHRLERRRINRDDELSEKDFEIYLEMKLQWLQQFYNAAISTKPEKKEDDGWNESIEEDLKFGKIEALVKSSKPEERRDEGLEKLREMVEILRSYVSNVVANYQNQKKNEGKPVSVVAKSEEAKECHCEGNIEDPEPEVPRTREGAITVVMIKERSEIGGDLEPPWKPETIDTQREGDSQEEPTPEKSPSEEPPPEPPEPPDQGGDTSEMCISHEGGATAKMVVQDCVLREGSLSIVTGSCKVEKIDGRIGDGREVRSDGSEPPLDTPDGAVTVAVIVQFARDLRKLSRN